MSKLNILVTGVGAIVGYGIVNSLRMSGRSLKIIGIDVFPDAVGQKFCDEFFLAKYASDSSYLNFLIKIIVENKIDLVFFGTEQELHKVSDHRELFGENVNKLVLNSKFLIDISKDKLKTYEFLMKCGEDVIPTRTDGTYIEIVEEFGIPFVLKLRRSYASKGVVIIRDEVDFNYWSCKLKGDFIIQKLVGDDDHEYTAAVFGREGDSVLGPFVMRRKLGQDGATVKAVVENLPELNQKVMDLAALFKPIGPTNFQFRYHQGKFLLLEVNPRVSSSTSIRAKLGYNESEMSVRHFLTKETIPKNWETQGAAVRYISDWVFDKNL